MLRTIDHIDEAILISNRVIELDPLNVQAYLIKGTLLLHHTHRTDEARLAFEKMEDLGVNAPALLADVSMAERDLVGIQKQLDRGSSDWESDIGSSYPYYQAAIAYLNGDKKRVNELVGEIMQSTPNVSFLKRSGYALFRGDMDQAIDSYGKAISERHNVAITICNAKAFKETVFPGFYTHPKYQQLLKEHGLDEESISKMRIPELPF